MNRYSINEIMEMAVQTERLGYQFYMQMAEKFKNDGGQVKLFTTLAAKEKGHEKTFIELKDMVAKQAAHEADQLPRCGPDGNSERPGSRERVAAGRK